MITPNDRPNARKRNSAQMSAGPDMTGDSPLLVGGIPQNGIQMPPNPLQQHLFTAPPAQPSMFSNPMLGNLSTADLHGNGMMGANGTFQSPGMAGRGFNAQAHVMNNGMNGTADAGNQLALRGRYPQSVVRLNPSYQFGAQPLGADHAGLTLANGDPTNAVAGSMLGVVNPIDEQAELAARIRKMKGKKANIPPFVQKLSQFVNDPKCDHLIRWSDSGESFLVLDEDEFSKTLIPDLFKHNNYASFVRQLNMYGFHKVVGLSDGSLKTSEQRSKPPSEYQNPYFKRGMPDLVWLIQKPKNNSKRKKGKKTKAEAESEEEDTSEGNADEGVGTAHGGLIEGTSSIQQQQKAAANLDLSNITHQLEALRNHQALISMAISKLKREHTQLYEQSRTFQAMHDRHEATINAILSFLATVYDKGLGGHIGGALANLFQSSAVADAIPRNQESGTVIGSPAAAVRNLSTTPSRALKRRPLLLENGPTGSNSFISNQTASPRMQETHNMPYVTSYHSPTTELFDEDEIQHNSNSPRNSVDGTVFNNNFRSPIQSLNKAVQSPINRSTSLTPRVQTRSVTPMTASSNQAQALLNSGKEQIEKHNELLRQKSDEIQHLEHLQHTQEDNIRQLVENLLHANRSLAGSNHPTPAGTTPGASSALNAGNDLGDISHVLGDGSGLDSNLDLGHFINDNTLFNHADGLNGSDFVSELDGDLDGELFNADALQSADDLGADSFASFHGLNAGGPGPGEAHNSTGTTMIPDSPSTTTLGAATSSSAAPAVDSLLSTVEEVVDPSSDPSSSSASDPTPVPALMLPETSAKSPAVLELDGLAIPDAKRRKVAT